MAQSSIVIVGGGFAGLNAALAARRVGGDDVSVTLISREPWLTIRPRLYEANPETLRASLIEPLATVGVTFVAGEATAVEDGCVSLRVGAPVLFDRLVIATGSAMQVPEITGVQYAHSIDDWSAAVIFDQRLAQIASSATPHLAVIGAGFTGIELALELRDRIAVHAGADAGERARITLIDRAPIVGAELGPGPRPAIEEALSAARVEVRCGVTIAAITADAVELAGGERIACDISVMCTGLRAAPLIPGVAGATDHLGRVHVDAALRVTPRIFAAGDVARALCSPNREALMSCQHALTLGKFAGENAARDALGQPLIDYSQLRYVTCLALGRSGAVFSEGWDRVPKVTGAAAKAIKTEINTRRIYPPTGDRAAILEASRLS